MTRRTVGEDKDTGALIREIAEGVSETIGEPFFATLAAGLSSALGADFALIGELGGEDRQEVRTLAVHALGEVGENITYELNGTPCDQVQSGGVCVYPRNVQHLFPADHLLTEMGVEAYVGTPLRAAGGEVVGLIVVLYREPLRDGNQSESVLRIFAARAAAEIQRVRTERRLLESEGRHRRLLDTLPHGVQVIDTAGVILYANPAHHQMYGYPEGGLIGRPMQEFSLTPEAGDELSAYLAHLVEEQPEPVPWFGRNRTADGRVLEVKVDWDYRRDERGEVTGFVSVITDVTAEKRAQAEAERGVETQAALNDLLRLSLVNLPLPSLLDRFLEIVTELPWLQLEKRGAVFLMAEDGSHLRLTRSLRLDPRVVERCDRVSIGECICGGAAEQRQVIFIPAGEHPPRSVPDSHGDHGHYCAPLLSANGELLGLLSLHTGAGQDRDERTLEFLGAAAHILSGVLERKRVEGQRGRLEEQLLQAQKMEAVGVLSSGIAHDFNNLLQAISGYTQLLLADAAAAPGSATLAAPDAVSGTDNVEYLTQIDRAVERAAGLVRDLLTFSRREPIDQRPLDLNREVEQAMRILERTLPRMVHIETRLAADLPPVRGDATQLEQVVLNLGTNARDAMPEGGTLVVSTELTELDAEDCTGASGLEPGPHLRLEVRDDGCGMDADIARRVFEPFFTTKGVGHGTGLGLSTVYGIVRSHHGEIHCSSRPGEGASFVVHLPALTGVELPELPPPQQPAQDSAGVETLLVVDDEPQISQLASMALEARGYRVLVADSGEEALGKYIQDRERIALVILDLGMPGMGGRRCLAELRKLNPDLKILVASGYSASDKVQEVLGSGAQRFIAKPYRLAELNRAVRELLDA